MTYFKGFTSDLVKRWRNVKAKAGSLLNMASYNAVQFFETSILNIFTICALSGLQWCSGQIPWKIYLNVDSNPVLM